MAAGKKAGSIPGARTPSAKSNPQGSKSRMGSSPKGPTSQSQRLPKARGGGAMKPSLPGTGGRKKKAGY